MGFVSIGGKEGWAPSTFIESKEMDAIPEVDRRITFRDHLLKKVLKNVSNTKYSQITQVL